MSQPLQQPLFVAGTPRSSGDVATGQLKTSMGGERAYTAYSGLTAAVLIWSGAGRLDTVMVLGSLASGQAVHFYDSAVATSGGPFAASGHLEVGYIPPVWREGASGVINPNSAPGLLNQIGMPFHSGLCAAPVASGCPGFTVSFSIERSTAFAGNP